MTETTNFNEVDFPIKGSFCAGSCQTTDCGVGKTCMTCKGTKALLGNYSDMDMSVLKKVGATTENSLFASFLIAQMRWSQGAFAEAAEIYEELIRELPKIPMLQHLRAMALFRANDIDPAIEIWREIISENAANGEVYLRLSQSLARKGQLREAINIAGDGLKQYPKSKALSIHHDRLVCVDEP